jgi:hypothetical protein
MAVLRLDSFAVKVKTCRRLPPPTAGCRLFKLMERLDYAVAVRIIGTRVTVVGAPRRELVFLELERDTDLTGVREVRMVNKTTTLVACIGELASRYVRLRIGRGVLRTAANEEVARRAYAEEYTGAGAEQYTCTLER